MARRTAQEAAQTRKALVAAARRLFAAHGYVDTPTSAVVRAAGVTRGALYHHFPDKRELFRAVVIDVEQEANEYVRAAGTRSDDPREAFLAGCRAAMEFARRPDFQRIALVDAPAVLGMAEWHAIDYGISLTSMGLGLKELALAGRIDREPHRALTVLMLGALSAACLEAGRPDPDRPGEQELLAAFARLIDGLAPGRAPVASIQGRRAGNDTTCW